MTTIEWTEKTWNVISGCNKVSPGCAHCYAETLAKRFWGDRPFTEVRFHPERLQAPIKRRKPTTYFVNSMSDLFHPLVTDEQLDQIFAVMALTPRHTYQVLTKRPERMLEYLNWCERRHNSAGKPVSYCRVDAVENATGNWSHCWEIEQWPLPNVWLGVTAENQKAANDRQALLFQTPAAVRFLSVEPQLEHVSIAAKSSALDWVICGGESGTGARPFDLAWARSLRDQCQAAGVAFFMKQGGTHPIGNGAERMTGKGNDFEQLPPDLQIRQMPAGVMA